MRKKATENKFLEITDLKSHPFGRSSGMRQEAASGFGPVWQIRDSSSNKKTG